MIHQLDAALTAALAAHAGGTATLAVPDRGVWSAGSMWTARKAWRDHVIGRCYRDYRRQPLPIACRGGGRRAAHAKQIVTAPFPAKYCFAADSPGLVGQRFNSSLDAVGGCDVAAGNCVVGNTTTEPDRRSLS